MPSKTIEDFAYQVRDYMRSAEVVEGKNSAYSQENNAVIATIENGKSYKVRWTGSATITLKKDSASGTEVTSGSISPLSFTADSDFDLYFGSSADVTEIMVYDGNDTSDTYEPYYVPVKDSKLSIADQQVLGAWNELPCNGSTGDNKSVIYTFNADGTVTGTGTASGGNSSINYYIGTLPAGDWYFGGGKDQTIKMGIRKTSEGAWLGDSSGQFVPVTIEAGVSYTVFCWVANGTNPNSYVWKPQLAKEPNQPYVPYAMTNRELTDEQDLINGHLYDISKCVRLTLILIKYGFTQKATSTKAMIDALPKGTYIAQIDNGYEPDDFPSKWGSIIIIRTEVANYRTAYLMDNNSGNMYAWVENKNVWKQISYTS